MKCAPRNEICEVVIIQDGRTVTEPDWLKRMYTEGSVWEDPDKGIKISTQLAVLKLGAGNSFLVRHENGDLELVNDDEFDARFKMVY